MWRPAMPIAPSLRNPVAGLARDLPSGSPRAMRPLTWSNLRSAGSLALSHKGLSGFVADTAHPCISDVPRWSSTGLFQPIDPTRLSSWADVIPELWDVDYNKTGSNVWLVPVN
jgi:hypothetical protein